MFRLLFRIVALRMATRFGRSAITAAKGRNKYLALAASLVAAKLARRSLKGR